MKKKIIILFLFVFSFYCFSKGKTEVENKDEVKLESVDNNFFYEDTFDCYKKEERSDNKTGVYVKVNKSKADVFINGTYQGKSDLFIEGLVFGEYQIQIKDSDANVITKKIEILSGYNMYYYFNFE